MVCSVDTRFIRDRMELCVENLDDTIFVHTVDLMGQRMTEFVNLKEEKVKEALINAGWTPPEELPRDS